MNARVCATARTYARVLFGPCAMRVFQGFSQGHALLGMVAAGCVTRLVSGRHSHEYTGTAP